MNILVPFFIGLALLVGLFVVVLLLLGFRPQKGSRYKRSSRGDGGTGSPGGDGGSSF